MAIKNQEDGMQEKFTQKAEKALLNLESIRLSNKLHSTPALEEVKNDVIDVEDSIKEEVVEEVEQVTVVRTIVESLEGNVVVVEEEVQLEKVVQE